MDAANEVDNTPPAPDGAGADADMPMGVEGRVLVALGCTAGIGGISLGVLFFIFKDVLAKNLIPSIGLEPRHAFVIH